MNNKYDDMGDAKEKVPEHKLFNLILITSVIPLVLFIMLIITMLVIILSSWFSPLTKANQVIEEIKEIVVDDGEDEDVLLFDKMKELLALKGNYQNSNAIETDEFKMFKQLYLISMADIYCGAGKTESILMVMGTLFYSGEFDLAMDSNNQNYDVQSPDINSLDDATEYNESQNIEIATKDIKKLYNNACKGYQSYQQYLVDKFIPTYYNNILPPITETEKRENEIAKIGEEMIMITDDYLVNSDMGYLIDYESYQIKIPIPLFSVLDPVQIISDQNYIPIYKTGEHNGIGWKQGTGSAWSGIDLGGSGGTMAWIGCYVTSIATAMAYSGTQINSEYFDPGVLAVTLNANGGFDSSGNLNNYNWNSLAPNFKSLGKIDSWDSSNDLKNQVKNQIDNGNSVVLHVNGGSHFIAVTGYDSNGNIQVSDPGGYIKGSTIESYVDGIVDYRVFSN